MRLRSGAGDAGCSWSARRAAAKPTLTLRLIQEGYEIEGDENVFVTPEGVVARPRGLRVKESAAALLPHLADTLQRRPLLPESARTSEFTTSIPVKPEPRSGVLSGGQWMRLCSCAPTTAALRPCGRVSSLALVREVMEECALARNRARRSGRRHHPSHWQCKRI